MSKQSVVKDAQGYRTEPSNCSNCLHYTSEHVEKSYESFGGMQTWTEEKNKRCGLGDFAVKKTATCRLWEAAPAKAPVDQERRA